MKVTKLDAAIAYSPARHSATVHSMYLQHRSTGSDAPYWIGCSYYLPGAEAEWDATPLPKVYVVLDGALTVTTDEGEETLGPMDSVSLAPNERRQVRNETNRVATMLVVMPYPPEPTTAQTAHTASESSEMTEGEGR
jgi:mannose-6-phosphate isomerase-like protein (cupin superfamily)